ncbi:MAG: adenylosuccinate lyase [Candidatus Omnitrophica bacterium]|nr:adenylosuccinate lyase [Candidatus Omnitrophota bacterium]
MIDRYTRREMGAVWTEEAKLKQWLAVEIAAAEALAKYGYIPRSVPAKLKRVSFDVKRVQEIEETVKHDVIAFLTNISESMGEDSRFVHYGLTSSDVLDTALALQIKEAGMVLRKGLSDLIDVLKERALEHQYTLMVGRSHGVHAEPTTFGLKIALFYAEFKRHAERLDHALDQVAFGKISGAVGTFANVDPQVEEYTCKLLGLKPEPISTQIIQRDRHAEFVATLALMGSSLEKLATEIRHLQKTETQEVQEEFSQGQKGSSAMPHKRNPVTCERIAGLSRILRGNAVAALENIALWHERDITHSSVERIIIPDTSILADYMLSQMTKVVRNLVVNKENMEQNLKLSRGMIFSQGLLLNLISKGLSREDTYALVQKASAQVWADEKMDLKGVALKDKEIRRYLSAKEIEVIFDFSYHTKNVNKIFARLGLGKIKRTTKVG